MYDANAIEAINFEQLATATDRLLLCGGRASKRRPTRPSLRDSRARALPRAFSQDTHARHFERTTIIRSRSSRAQVFSITVVIPMLAGITAGLAALL